jgi:GrpB-like predicted nucleotidyltransferase (UPF0157 family)/chloramphenicol 3-O-phosphotransferase
VGTDLIVLNGGSSSGKTSIARCLQELLPRPWLTLGIDDLLGAMPLSAADEGTDLVSYGPDGSVTVGTGFRRLEGAWTDGVAAIARAGTGVIVDDVFLDGAESQARLRDRLDGLEVLWVGVHCAPEVAAGREATRADRKPGMARAQAEVVHRGVTYDVEVDTTSTSALSCADAVHGKVTRSGRGAPSGAQGSPSGTRPPGAQSDEQGAQWEEQRPVVVEYDPGWPRRAAQLVAVLVTGLAPSARRVEHIGSTSVPGMPAKDVLDLQVSVDELEMVGTFDSLLQDLGFRRSSHERDHVPAGRGDDPGQWAKRLWVRRGHVDGDVNLHVRRVGSPNERMALLFRDWLRAHPEAIPAYATFKRSLAAVTADIGTYTDVKDPVVDLVVVIAEGWAETVGWQP